MASGMQPGTAVAEPPAEPPRMAGIPGLAELYGQHFRYVWRCLRSLGVRDRELDDAIQDLFLVVQSRLPEFDGQVATRTWLYAIAIRIARRYRERQLRASSRGTRDTAELDRVSSGRDTEAEYHQSERLVVARLALAALDPGKREVFVLGQIEQMSAPEISAVIGIPLNTVYSRLRAARSAFVVEVQRIEAQSGRLP